MMNYPTMDQIEAATREKICEWYRFLPSPGELAVGSPSFAEVMALEVPLINRIHERFVSLGGFTPEISKHIGWEKR